MLNNLQNTRTCQEYVKFADKSVIKLLTALLPQLCDLKVDKLACGAGGAAIFAQGKTFGKQKKLLPGNIQPLLVGKLLDNVEIIVLIRYGKGDFQAETVGQGGNGFERVTDVDVVTLTVGKTLVDQVTAI